MRTIDVKNESTEQQASALREIVSENQFVRVIGSRLMASRYDLQNLCDLLVSESESGEQPDFHGAIVLTNCKDQSMDMYRRLKTEHAASGSLKVRRFGSISFLMPHVAAMKELSKLKREELEATSYENMFRSADWDDTDVLVCTYNQLENLLTSQHTDFIRKLNPKYFLVEDAEIMMAHNLEAMRKIFRVFFGKYRSSKAEFNLRRKVVWAYCS